MTRDRPVLEVFRAPMRSRDDDVSVESAVQWALERGVVGVGGRLPDPPQGRDDAVELVRERHGDRMANRLRRFIEVEISSFVWTRTPELGHRLGRVRGPWAFDGSSAAADVDLPHTRACHWIDDPVPAHEVPDAVAIAFERGGRNFQRIRSEAAEHETRALWEHFDPA